MATGKYILEIEDFPTKGVKSKINVKDYGFIHHPRFQNEMQPRWDKEFNLGYPLLFGIRKEMDLDSATIYKMGTISQNTMDISPESGFGVDELSSRNPISNLFPKMTFSINSPNAAIDFEFFEVKLTSYFGYIKGNVNSTYIEEIKFRFKKMNNFEVSLVKTTSP